MMHVTDSVEGMGHAASSAHTHAEEAAEELGRAVKMADEVEEGDEELADEVRDSLQEAADKLHEALGEVERFL